MKRERTRVAATPHEAAIESRMQDIARILADTATRATIEPSALIGVAATVLAIRQGMPADGATRRRFTRLLFGRLAPLVEEVLDEL